MLKQICQGLQARRRVYSRTPLAEMPLLSLSAIYAMPQSPALPVSVSWWLSTRPSLLLAAIAHFCSYPSARFNRGSPIRWSDQSSFRPMTFHST